LNRTLLLPAACLLDQVAGDPEWFPHPVCIMGFAVSRGEFAMRREHQTKRTEFIMGAALSLTVVASSYYLSRQLMRFANRRSPALGDAIELILGWTCLAARSLEQEATSVADALGTDDLTLARTRLARIVGRDTEHLNVEEINRAIIETLAESASDGIVSPLFYMAIGGVPLAMAFKAVNTLDSMIGHADARYFYFGKAAARLDDAANFIPARLTALGIVAASRFLDKDAPPSAWQTWRRDGGKHKSPNAGQPESAMAGALHVRLGGDNVYEGEVVPSAHMGREFPRPSLKETKEAIRLVSLVTLLGLCCGMIYSAYAERRSSRTISR
jgi:adenosylcobinamide-phosphate synthase